jgi:hypothetical protein
MPNRKKGVWKIRVGFIPGRSSTRLSGVPEFSARRYNYSCKTRHWTLHIPLTFILNNSTPVTLKKQTKIMTLFFIFKFPEVQQWTVCCILSFGWLTGFWILSSDVSEHSIPSSLVVWAEGIKRSLQGEILKSIIMNILFRISRDYL